ncbi:MAG: hypothetical protein ACLGIA_03460 [Actinomycetes bacterium]
MGVGRFERGTSMGSGGFLSRRQILEAVAAGRLRPGEAVPLLDRPPATADAGPAPLRRLCVRSAYRFVRLVGDASEASVSVVSGRHALVWDGDVLHVADAADAPWFAVASAPAVGELVLRVNPHLDVEVDVTGGRLHVHDLEGPVRLAVKSGSASVERVSGSLSLEVVGGSASVLGTPAADWRIRVESASLVVSLDARSDVTVVPTSRHSNVDVLAAGGAGTLGAGTHTLSVDAAFADVHVVTAPGGLEGAWPST